MGMGAPFSLLREVRVISSSRAATTASSKKSSQKSPRRNMSRALGTCCLMWLYCRMSGVAASLMGSGADPPARSRPPRRLVHHGEADFVGEKRVQGDPRGPGDPPHVRQ